MPLDEHPFPVDPDQPWQVQRAERLSRGVNARSPHVRRQIRLALLVIGAILLFVVVVFVGSALR